MEQQGEPEQQWGPQLGAGEAVGAAAALPAHEAALLQHWQALGPQDEGGRQQVGEAAQARMGARHSLPLQ